MLHIDMIFKQVWVLMPACNKAGTDKLFKAFTLESKN